MYKFNAICIYVILVCFNIESREQRNLAITVDLAYQEFFSSSKARVYELKNLINSSSCPIITNTLVLEGLISCISKCDIERLVSEFELYQKYDFLLIVPKSYKLNFSKKLGFDLDGFKLISPDLNANKSKTKLCKNIFFKFLYEKFPYALEMKSNQLIDLLKKLLISKDKLDDIEWNIYFSGHGGNIYQTLGITENSFKKLLKLLQYHINTRALYCSSCYFSGTMRDYLFSNEKYPFIIFCEGISGSLTYVSTGFDFKLFFDSISKVKNDSYDEILKEFVAQVFQMHEYNANNIISIRLANSGIFLIPSIADTVFVVDDSSNCNPINVDSSKNVIINAPIIHKTINISCLGHIIISGLPGSCGHYIENIIASNITYADLFKAFWLFDYIDAKKVFLIKEILCDGSLQDLINKYSHEKISNGSQFKLQNVIIFRHFSTPSSLFFKKVDNEIFFMIDDIGYSIVLNSGTYGGYSVDCRQLDDKLTKKYLEFFESSKKKIERGEQFLNIFERLTESKLSRQAYPWTVTGLFLLISFMNYKNERRKQANNDKLVAWITKKLSFDFSHVRLNF